MINELLNFLRDEPEFFIEAEAKPSRMNNFINDYNNRYGEALSFNDNGIILLQDDADKRGLELRLYVRNCPPPSVKSLGFTRNNAYRGDYSYRLNNNDIIKTLFDNGYRIGVN